MERTRGKPSFPEIQPPNLRQTIKSPLRDVGAVSGTFRTATARHQTGPCRDRQPLEAHTGHTAGVIRRGTRMPRQRELRVLLATDGSRDAKAAIDTTLHFPWPGETLVRVISARRTRAEYRRSLLLTALGHGAEKAADSARRTLSLRWPDVQIEVLDKSPVEGILGEAERFQADVIVVGWRGHGAVRRLLMGSVSRASTVAPGARYLWSGSRSAFARSLSVSTVLKPQSAAWHLSAGWRRLVEGA
jgi:nucleotide-binding universal stress UspA family protein